MTMRIDPISSYQKEAAATMAGLQQRVGFGGQSTYKAPHAQQAIQVSQPIGRPFKGAELQQKMPTFGTNVKAQHRNGLSPLQFGALGEEALHVKGGRAGGGLNLMG